MKLWWTRDTIEPVEIQADPIVVVDARVLNIVGIRTDTRMYICWYRNSVAIGSMEIIDFTGSLSMWATPMRPGADYVEIFAHKKDFYATTATSDLPAGVDTTITLVMRPDVAV